MTRRWTALALTVGTLVALSLPSQAQIFGTGVLPVTEVGPSLWQNTITAVESVAQTINMVLELTPVDELIVAQGIADDLALLQEILAQAQGLAYDLETLNAQITALFDLETAPATRPALDARLTTIRQTVAEVRRFALCTQTLLATVLRTIDHLRGLLDSVGALLGNMQGNQRLIEVHSTVSKTLAVQLTMNTAFQRADVVERLSKELLLESLGRIQATQLDGWPR
jgi:conjugal transfer/entry exclusion protein